MIAVDFFCGAGGLTRGLLNSGVSVDLGIDSDDRCRETYVRNNPSVSFLAVDVRDVQYQQIRQYLGNIDCNELLFAGCAPCQPFSQQRKRSGKPGVGTLLGCFSEFVQEVLPGQVFIENVPGITRVSGYSTYRRFIRTLEDCGYEYDEGVVDAKSYGVPQNRRRYILIAMRGVTPSLPPKVCGPGLLPFRTVRETIRQYPRIRAGQQHSSIANHVAADISEINMERLRHTPQNGGDRRAWPSHLVLACHSSDYNGHSDVYGRMWWDKPAPALTGRCHSISNGRYGHPSQNRAISLREAASLQTFEGDYIFYGSNKHIALQIGNAVPVKLAEHVGRHLLALRNGASASGTSRKVAARPSG
ncbi:MAG: DNA cytosine methyltransferase [Planctomycetes bacterium]|nr:DNA cytosine methyltransferase [Planctomycetota bacterium]MBL7040001.1 DNA cytosine methyltransferase [Pirellulaceae bacterium]